MSTQSLQTIFIAVVLSFLFHATTLAHEATAKHIVGYVESILLFPSSMKIHAKVDSGAENSSLNARDLQYFQKGGADWVRFTVMNSDKETSIFEYPVVRTAKIKRHFDKTQERPVIILGICLGAVYREAEVNLVDRSGFNYQMLIGRTFLQGNFLIDPEKSFLLQPICKVKP